MRPITDLHKKLIRALSFYKPWQLVIKNNCDIADDDTIKVFLLICFFPHLEKHHKIKSQESKKFVELCFNCLIQHLIQHPKGYVINELNDLLDSMFIDHKINPDGIEANRLKTSLSKYIDSLYPKKFLSPTVKKSRSH